MTKILYQEAKQKFDKQARTDIQLCKDGFKGWNKKSKFIDLILNQEFWSKPYDVFRKKSAPLRNGRQKILYNEAKERFEKQGRTDIQLCKDGFKGWNKKSKFIETETNREFWSIPKTVYKIKSSPLRIVENRIKTSLKRYGTKNPAQSKEVKAKIKKIMLERYGVENVMHLNQIKEKIKKTSLEKYGVKCNLQLEKTKEQIKQTCLKKYGCKSPMQNKKIKEKVRKTNLERYGVECKLQLEDVKKQIKQTCLQKYGAAHPTQSNQIKQKFSNRFIKEIEEHLSEWLKEQKEPKPGYSTLIHYFPNEEISLNDLENYLKNYRENKTNLEVFTENLFNIKHFNRKPKKINVLYKPDFKLNDKIYLNVDGLYWHCEEQKGKYYHSNLQKEFEENGLRIFQFHENEMMEKTDIIKSIINNAIGKISNNIFARKCQIKPISHVEAQVFLNQNHFMGSITAKHIGLYCKNELVSILSYKHKKQRTVCNIERFCSKIDVNVDDAFPKLLKYLESNCLESNCQEIHNWIDLRYEIWEHLLNKGFELKKETLGWRWANRETTFNCSKYRANQAKELGLHKIYNAGQRLYVKMI